MYLALDVHKFYRCPILINILLSSNTINCSYKPFHWNYDFYSSYFYSLCLYIYTQAKCPIGHHKKNIAGGEWFAGSFHANHANNRNHFLVPHSMYWFVSALRAYKAHFICLQTLQQIIINNISLYFRIVFFSHIFLSIYRLLCNPDNIDDAFVLESRGLVTMKGKAEPMKCWYLNRSESDSVNVPHSEDLLG